MIKMTFRNILLNEAANKDVVSHLTHLEDTVIDDGLSGIQQAASILTSMVHSMSGNSKSHVNITMKVDGAPSIFAGIDPEDGKFFVAKKSIFNKVPKVYKTLAEVHADTSGELAEKMADALQYLPKVGIKGILQGDFMFSHKDLKKTKIDGETYLTFHPNTIVYAVPFDSDLAKQIMKSKIGVVWHTAYTGKTLSTLKAASAGAIASKLNQTKDVWFIDATIKNQAGTATFTSGETAALLSEISKIANFKINKAMISELASGDIRSLINIYNNSVIRTGSTKTPEEHVSDFVDWIIARFDKEIASKKDGTKAAEAKKSALKFFAKYSKVDIAKVYQLQNMIVEVKLSIIKKMSEIASLSTFLKTRSGFKVTGQEGFVVTDSLGKNAVKLVDRIEFSKANFDSTGEIIKGWQ